MALTQSLGTGIRVIKRAMYLEFKSSQEQGKKRGERKEKGKEKHDIAVDI